MVRTHALRPTDRSTVSTKAVAVCYRSQCQRTAELVAKRLGIPDGKWSVSFQSRLGKDKWIEPYTEARLDELAKAGVKRLLVMCPAFVADCIETLEGISDRGREQFIEAGGPELVLNPCCNDDPAWAQALVELCEEVAELPPQRLEQPRMPA